MSLTPFAPEMNDFMEMKPGQNPFTARQSCKQADKKELLRIYQIQKLLNTEIDRLEQKNRSKKVLLRRILQKVQQIIHLPPNMEYKLAQPMVKGM